MTTFRYMVTATKKRMFSKDSASWKSLVDQERMYTPLDERAVPVIEQFITLFDIDTSHWRSISKIKKPNAKFQGSLAYVIQLMNKMMADKMKAKGFKVVGYTMTGFPLNRLPSAEQFASIDQFAIDMSIPPNKNIEAIGFFDITLSGDGTEPAMHQFYTLTSDRNQPKFDDDRYIEAEKGDVIGIDYLQSYSTMDDSWHHHPAEKQYFLVTRRSTGSMTMRRIYEFDPDTFCWGSLSDPIKVKRKTVSNVFFWDYFYNEYWFQDRFRNPELIRP